MDMLCQQLGMDPLEFRLRNASVTGSTMPIGTPFPAIGLTTILERVREHACWRDPLPEGPPAARTRPCARLLARHVHDLGGAHHDRRRRPPDGDDGRGRPLGHAHHHGAGGGRGVRARRRGHPHPHRRLQVGRLQRWRGRQPRRAHHDGGAGRGEPRRARPIAPARRREAAMRGRSSSTMRAARSGRATGRRRDLARRADAGDADRRRRGRPRRLDQAAARRRDRRACVRRRGRHRAPAW